MKVLLKTRCGCTKEVDLFDPPPPSYVVPMLQRESGSFIPDNFQHFMEYDKREFKHRGRDNNNKIIYEELRDMKIECLEKENAKLKKELITYEHRVGRLKRTHTPEEIKKWESRRLIAYIWYCGDEDCDCHQAQIEELRPDKAVGYPWVLHFIIWRGTYYSEPTMNELGKIEKQLCEEAHKREIHVEEIDGTFYGERIMGEEEKEKRNGN